MIRGTRTYATPENGYYAVGQGAEIFGKHYPKDVPKRGFKIHLSIADQDVERAAPPLLPAGASARRLLA